MFLSHAFSLSFPASVKHRNVNRRVVASSIVHYTSQEYSHDLQNHEFPISTKDSIAFRLFWNGTCTRLSWGNAHLVCTTLPHRPYWQTFLLPIPNKNVSQFPGGGILRCGLHHRNSLQGATATGAIVASSSSAYDDFPFREAIQAGWSTEEGSGVNSLVWTHLLS